MSEEDYLAGAIAYVGGLLKFRPRTRDTAAGAMPKVTSWLRKRGLDDEVRVEDIAATAVIKAMWISRHEKNLGKVMGDHKFQRDVEKHNQIARGIVVSGTPLARLVRWCRKRVSQKLGLASFELPAGL
jgi:hypothetical protein